MVLSTIFPDDSSFKVDKLHFQQLNGQSRLAFIAANFPEMLSEFEITKKTAKGLPRFESVKFAKGRYRVPTSEDLDNILSKLEDRGFQQIEDTRKRMSESPLFRAVFARAGGDLGQFESDLTAGFGKIGSRALGAASASGNITTPALAARALGPLALQRAQIMEQMRQQAQNQAMSLTMGMPIGAGNLGPGMSLPESRGLIQALYQGNMAAMMANQSAKYGLAGAKSSAYMGALNPIAGLSAILGGVDWGTGKTDTADSLGGSGGGGGDGGSAAGSVVSALV